MPSIWKASWTWICIAFILFAAFTSHTKLLSFKVWEEISHRLSIISTAASFYSDSLSTNLTTPSAAFIAPIPHPAEGQWISVCGSTSARALFAFSDALKSAATALSLFLERKRRGSFNSNMPDQKAVGMSLLEAVVQNLKAHLFLHSLCIDLQTERGWQFTLFGFTALFYNCK